MYRAILDAICAGELPAGERLTQDQLAARLNVSRQPVLQALLLLRKQGFVRETGRRGVVVAALDPAFIGQLYEVRAALDGAACRAAALLEAAGRGRTDAPRRGSRLIAQGRAAVRSGSVAAMIAADMDFHLFLYELSGNPLIAETAAPHWHHIRRVMGGYLQRHRARDAIWDEHAAILEAVIAGDAAEAARRARHHAEAAAANFRDAMRGEAPQAADPPLLKPAG